MLAPEIPFEEMQPGDLVFVSGTYNAKSARPFQHRMVHVEVYTGRGEAREGTVGARWQRGVVQHHPTFRFESKNYHDVRYHFKSIAPWLRGDLRSYCAEHDWRDDRNLWLGEKYSVFCVDEDGERLRLEPKRELPRLAYVGEGNNSKLVEQHLQARYGLHDECHDRGFYLMDRARDQFNPDFAFKWVQQSNAVDYLS